MAPSDADPPGPSSPQSNRRQRDEAARGRGRGGNPGGRGRGGAGRGRGRGRGGAVASASSTLPPQPEESAKVESSSSLPELITKNAPSTAKVDQDAEVCFICANPVIHHSIAPCNHKTCHICGLRMRALYKTKDCAHCRTPAPFVIFTDDATKRFEEYGDQDFTSTDGNIGIRYTNEDIVGDTVLLLRYNCPDPSCDFAGLGWPDLHRHVRSVHHKKMCDLCTRNKKVFTHEHDLFTDKELEKHMRKGDDQPGALDQTGFKGHPLCGFCGQRFYDDDKLYEHCRHKHERCFLCDREDSRQPHYYLDYNALEEHFRRDHFLCYDRECLEKKFIVFGSELDLKAHQLAEHGNTLSKDVRRDARVVDMSGFDYRQTYQQERRGGGHGGREGHGRGRGRDPNADQPPLSSAQPLRRDEMAFQRQLAIHSAQSVSNRTFGGQLTAPSSSTAAPAPVPTPSGRQSNTAGPAPQPIPPAAPLFGAEGQTQDIASLPPQDRARLVRHGAVIERASNMLGNDATKMATFREHISSFRAGKLLAPQLVDAFFTLFADVSSNALGTLVREVADLFEDKAKGEGLRTAWQDWRAINEDYPSLPGLGGMHGATTSSSGWAAAAAASPTAPAAAPSQKHSTRVLRLKNSTRRGSASSAGSSTTWTPPQSSVRPLPSSAFPALPATSSTPVTRPSWVGASTSTNPPRQTASGSRNKSNEEAFPALPAAPKPLTTIFGYGTGAVRRDIGAGRNTGFSWGQNTAAGPAGAGAGAGAGASEVEEEAASESQGKKKKGNKGKKQVLVAWG